MIEKDILGGLTELYFSNIAFIFSELRNNLGKTGYLKIACDEHFRITESIFVEGDFNKSEFEEIYPSEGKPNLTDAIPKIVEYSYILVYHEPTNERGKIKLRHE